MVGPDRCVILTLVLKIRAETKILARNGLLKKAASVSHCGTGDDERPVSGVRNIAVSDSAQHHQGGLP